MLTIWRRARV